MIGWMWGVVGAIAGTMLGVTGAAIGAYNSKRIVRGGESFLGMKKWNVYDSFYVFLIIVGLLSLKASLFLIRSEMMDDGYASSLLSLAFLSTGGLNATIRVRALLSLHFHS